MEDTQKVALFEQLPIPQAVLKLAVPYGPQFPGHGPI